MITLKQATKYLADNGYLIQNRGRYLLTSKFYKETTGEDYGIVVIDKPVVKKVPIEKPKQVDWVELYQKFIMESKIPQSSFSTSGESYRINTATKPGREAFKKAIEGGTTYEQLMEAVKIYYSESRTYRVKIEKFFIDEMWRSIDPTDTQSQNARAITKPRLA